MSSHWLDDVWMDGALVPFSQATTHVSTDFALRGLSVFEGIRAYPIDEGPLQGGVHILGFQHHRRRLLQSARALRMPIDEAFVDEVMEGVLGLVRANAGRDLYLRPTIALRDGAYAAAASCESVTAFVLGRYPAEVADPATPRTATVSPWRHVSAHHFPVHAKVGAQYAQYHLVRADAAERGFDEAILLDAAGMLTETRGASIFRATGAGVETPPLEAGILASVTRGIVLQIVKRLTGESAVERAISHEEMLGPACAFLTGTLDEVVELTIEGAAPASEADRHLVARIIAEYRRQCRRPSPEDVEELGSHVETFAPQTSSWRTTWTG